MTELVRGGAIEARHSGGTTPSPPYSSSLLSGLRKLSIRGRLHLALARAREESTLRMTDPGRPHVFLALAADYGNLGDLAITHAQLSFLRRTFPDAVVEEIPISRSLPAIRRLERVIRPDDIITLIGGGNTGDMYDDIQCLRELFIARFPDNRIVSFPQTIEFSRGLYGRYAAKRAMAVYNRHPRLCVVARDSRSLVTAERLFSRCRIVCAPDVVVTLDRSSPSQARQGIILSLRADLERGLDAHFHASLVSTLRDLDTVHERDTHVGDVRLSREQADAELHSMWSAYRSARLVVTDRLHGMIFATITGTPCVVLDSGTGKVSQFYGDWLQEVRYVRLVASPDPVEVRNTAQRLLDADAAEPPASLRECFDARILPGLAGSGADDCPYPAPRRLGRGARRSKR